MYSQSRLTIASLRVSSSLVGTFSGSSHCQIQNIAVRPPKAKLHTMANREASSFRNCLLLKTPDGSEYFVGCISSVPIGYYDPTGAHLKPRRCTDSYTVPHSMLPNIEDCAPALEETDCRITIHQTVGPEHECIVTSAVDPHFSSIALKRGFGVVCAPSIEPRKVVQEMSIKKASLL